MEDSPIIQRLKEFIASTGLSSTQFADKASIPRPTLSQLLHGRNKSINNQILTKLDESFPELDVVWLLFGRRTGQSSSNIKISEPQNAVLCEDKQMQITDGKEFVSSQQSLFNLQQELKSTINPASESIKLTSQAQQGNDEILKGIPEESNGRKITSIIVLYSDNSFETFNPAN